MRSWIPTVRKALVAGVVAAAGLVVTANADGSITGQEWSGIVATALATAVLTWAVPNRKAGGSSPDRG